MACSRNSLFSASRVGFISLLSVLSSTLLVPTASAQPSPAVAREVETQPFVAQVRRLVQAMEVLGEPFSAAELRALENAINARDGNEVRKIQGILDAQVFFAVTINPEMRVSVGPGAASTGTGRARMAAISGEGRQINRAPLHRCSP